jgi:hypothetical protein
VCAAFPVLTCLTEREVALGPKITISVTGSMTGVPKIPIVPVMSLQPEISITSNGTSPSSDR